MAKQTLTIEIENGALRATVSQGRGSRAKVIKTHEASLPKDTAEPKEFPLEKALELLDAARARGKKKKKSSRKKAAKKAAKKKTSKKKSAKKAAKKAAKKSSSKP